MDIELEAKRLSLAAQAVTAAAIGATLEEVRIGEHGGRLLRIEGDELFRGFAESYPENAFTEEFLKAAVRRSEPSIGRRMLMAQMLTIFGGLDALSLRDITGHHSFYWSQTGAADGAWLDHKLEAFSDCMDIDEDTSGALFEDISNVSRSLIGRNWGSVACAYDGLRSGEDIAGRVTSPFFGELSKVSINAVEVDAMWESAVEYSIDEVA